MANFLAAKALSVEQPAQRTACRNRSSLSLQQLELDTNQLSALPAEIDNLTRLIKLCLDNNLLQTPPPEIVAQGIQAIFAYLQALLMGGRWNGSIWVVHWTKLGSYPCES